MTEPFVYRVPIDDIVWDDLCIDGKLGWSLVDWAIAEGPDWVRGEDEEADIDISWDANDFIVTIKRYPENEEAE